MVRIKEIRIWVLLFGVVLVISGCKSNNQDNKTTSTTIQSTPKSVSENIQSSSTSTTESLITKESTTESGLSELNLYNELPLDIKIKLIASIVDDRAMSFMPDNTEARMFNIFYSIYDDKIYVNVHSGAGVGHPIYLISYDSETVTPVEGVVNAGVGSLEEVTGFDKTTVTKKSLYEKYISNKTIFDSNNVVPEDLGDDTKDTFDSIKSKLTK